ncbi:MAG: hypothetical protein U5K31_11715 [Balneolaceae bacterium]|nr:hypothetical protein [Balneolaceae bacterium]
MTFGAMTVSRAEDSGYRVISMTCLAFGLLALLLSSCDTSMEPFDRTQGFYSLYSYLDVRSDINYIRVKNLNEPLRENSNRQLPVTVTLENLENGETEVLEDSIQKIDGIYTHNFRTTTDLQYDVPYRVTVTDSAGNRVYAETRTPRNAKEHSFPSPPNCKEQFELSYHGVTSPNNLSVEAGIQFRGQVYWKSLPMVKGDSTNESQFRFTLKELIDENLYHRGYNAWCHHLSDDSLYVRYRHFSDELFGTLESDTVSVPGGTGQFGSGYREAYRLPIDTTNVCYPFCGVLIIDPDCPPDCGETF